MISIPKPTFFERKKPVGQSEDDYFDEITHRQTHFLQDAIDRVSLKLDFYVIKYIKLINPSVVNPAGILMLKSVLIVFELIGINPESIKFIKQEFNSSNLVEALTRRPKKCPAVVTFNFDHNYTSIMVATNALKGHEFIRGESPLADSLRNQWFITCKNSIRDDILEPGTI